MILDKRVSIVIPCRNEEGSIARIVGSALKYGDEVIVVSNCSTDNTVAIATAAGAKVLVDDRTLNGIGYGFALMTGIAAATGDLVATIDGDGSCPVAQVPEVIKYLQDKRLDFVNCTRFPVKNLSEMPLIRQIGVHVLNIVPGILFGKLSADILSGMWVFKKSITGSLNLREGDWNLSPEIKISAMTNPDIKYGEFRINTKARIAGNSKQIIWKTGITHLMYIVNRRWKEVNIATSIAVAKIMNQKITSSKVAKVAGLAMGILVLAFLANKSAFAADYGGGVTGATGAAINKQVLNSVNGNWQDNVAASDHTFVTGDLVKYRIFYRNNGNQDLTSVSIVDRLPTGMVWQSGDGNYEKGDNTVTFDVGTLKADTGWKEVDYTAEMTQVITKTSCGDLTNIAIFKSGSNELDRDSASINARCTVTTPRLPETGPEVTFAMTVISLALGAVGVSLKKKSA
ncbi:MAG: glycosyltransferase [candidate division WWE3 bacterium]|nr:glycosyltransferase [candidate division WWE3 bacterium]